MTEVLTKLITAEELLAMGDVGRCELMYGELVMMSPAGAEHGVVAGRLYRFLAEFVERHQLGETFTAETGFKIETNPDLVLAPDASFVSLGRLPGVIPRGYFPGVPDLAIEVVSPGDAKREVAAKKNVWLAHGTSTVWIAEPLTQTVSVHRVGAEPIVFHLDDVLTAEPLLAGFQLEIRRIFQQRR